MQIIENQTVEPGDIENPSCGSEYINCVFSGSFEGKNMSYTLFDGCSYDTSAEFIGCNLSGSENLPPANICTECNRSGGAAINIDAEGNMFPDPDHELTREEYLIYILGTTP